MIVILRTIMHGALIGIVFGVAIGIALGIAGDFKYDRHGFAFIAFILIFAVLGAMLGFAGGLGALIKEKFEGQSDEED